jgi:hypothetical protein
VKPWYRIGVAVLVCLGLSGCYFTSQNPLPQKPEVDKELLGGWRAVADQKNPSADGYAVFVRDQDGWLEVLLMERYYESSEIYRGFCSEIKGEKYLNVKKVNFGKSGQQADLDANFYLLHYRIVGRKRLEISLLNETLFKQAVKTRQLAGHLSPKEDEFTLTCTTDQLVAFLSRQKPTELLGEPMTPMEKTDQLPKDENPQR